MYLQSISHAVPPHAFSQKEAWAILQHSGALNKLSERSAALLEKVLLGDSGIEQRYFATENPTQLFTLDAETLNQNFEHNAPRLARDALTKALAEAHLNAHELDALFICTCTGYICPGLTSHVAELLNLDPQTYLQDIVGLGCGAAIPTLRSAQGFLAANPNATVACIAVEVCSAAFYLDNDPGVLISACLFGDAASASIWSNNDTRTGYRIQKFDTYHAPKHREALRFTNSAGKLRNQLHRSVPEIAAPIVHNLFNQSEQSPDTPIISHTGGRDVLDALETVLPTPLTPSRNTLKAYGNVSSPSVLITLETILQDTDLARHYWLTAFGAGFAAHSCELVNG
ncbi:MAG TPA: stilbene synthase [Opitutae bacterium]|nr:stilbene synthase [Opitutae bacterium]